MSERTERKSPRPHGGPGPGPGMGMRPPAEKAKDFKGTLRRLIRYLQPHSSRLLGVLVAAILSTVFSIISPKVMAEGTDILSKGAIAILQGVQGAGIDFPALMKVLYLLGGLYLFSAAFMYVQQYLMAGVAQRVVYDMREQISAKVGRLPLKYFDSRTTGETLSRATNDVDNISNTLQQSLAQFITSIVTIVGVIIMMLTISPWMTLITILTLPLSVVVVMLVASRSQKHFAGQQKSLGN